MKYLQLILLQILVYINFVISSNINNQNFFKRLEQANSLLSNEGPTINVLEHYDNMVKDIETGIEIELLESRKTLDEAIKEQLPQLYYKKALIEINLNKENMAINDLKKALKLDPGKKPARARLIELYLEKGDFEHLKEILSNEDQELLEKINRWEESYKKAEGFLRDKKYESCIKELDDNVLSLTPLNLNAYQLHYECLQEIFKNQITLEDNESSNKVIIHDLSKLIKIKPVQNLNWYESISNYLLFTENHFEKSRLFIKNCLRINNEFKSCGTMSKFFTKFQVFLKTLEDYSITNEHYYLNNENGNANLKEDLNNEFDFKFVNGFLFNDEIKVSKLEKKQLPYNVKNNYDYLIFKASKFLKDEVRNVKLLNDLKFIEDLHKISCESFIQINEYKKSNKYCSKVDSEFLPKSIPEIDKLLKDDKFDEAQKLLDKFNNNVKKTKLFTERYSKIQSYHKRQEQHSFRERMKQQRQQQHQQKFRQHQQGQRQNTPPPVRKPTNDYYKVLDISRDADDKTIRKAYRTQTLKYHPDKYKGNDLTPDQIEKKMQNINQAYEVLSNKQLRERYERGDDPNDPFGGQPQQQQQQQQHNPFNGGHGQRFRYSSGQDDFMRQFMRQQGGGFNFGGFGGQNFNKNKKRKY